MTQTEKLTEALESISDLDQKTTAEIAEALADKGVALHPVCLGQTLWAYLAKAIRPCTVDTLICVGDAKHEDCIFNVRTAEGVGCQYRIKDIGVAVFDDEETAKIALAKFVEE